MTGQSLLAASGHLLLAAHTRLREFEAMQRETWLAAQDALRRYSDCVEQLAISHVRTRRQPDWKRVPEPGPGEPTMPPVPEPPELAADYQRALFESAGPAITSC